MRRVCGDTLVELGRVLSALRNEFFAQGGSGRFGSNTPVGTEEKGIVHPRNNKGWEATVWEKAGIPPWTARRLIDEAKYTMLARCTAAGEAVTYTNTRKEKVVISPNPEMIEEAQKLLPDIEMGLVKPSTAWRGIIGESTRRTRQGGVKDRAPVDHVAIMLRAFRSIRSVVKTMEDLPMEDQHAIDRAWLQIANILPPKWVQQIPAKKQK